MRSLMIILLILIASVWVGAEMGQHPGYALFTYRQWVVEMPLWFALISAVIAFTFFYFILRLIAFFKNLDIRWHQWLAERRRYKACDKTQRGLLALKEEQWQRAERYLLEGIDQSKNPVINYLAAAEAAYEQKAVERSDAYLRKAYQAVPQDEIVIGLAEAKLQMEQGQLEQALATLTRLHKVAHYHPVVLKMLEKIYIRFCDWPNLLGLLPLMQKAKVINANQYFIFEKNIYCEMLDDAVRKNMSVHAVRELWHNMPKKIRLHHDVLERYAKLLKEDKGSADELEPFIRKVLHKEWHDDLGKIYGTLATSEPLRQLAMAESWLKQYGKRPVLLLTLGRLCIRCQLWGKARHYLEEELKQEKNTEAQLELAKLFEQLGETQLALRHYKDGLELAIQ